MTSTAFEQEYYEAEAFWVPEALGPADLERVRVVTEHIPSAVRTIVDVGCGNGLFVNSLMDGPPGRFDRILGIDRSETALRHVRSESVRASVDALPLDDGAFDIATCMEVVEHLPIAIFADALRELSRVSRRYILITVPNDEDISLARVECTACGCIFNLDYHLRSFDDVKLRRLFSDTHDCVDIFPIVDAKTMRPTVLRAWRQIRVLAGYSRPPTNAMCPMCGKRETGSPSTTTTPGNERPRRMIRQLASKLLVVRRPQWLGALYRRRGA